MVLHSVYLRVPYNAHGFYIPHSALIICLLCALRRLLTRHLKTY